MQRLILASLVLVLGQAVVVAPANAQATRTWVSGVGDDANPCSRTAPCKTFAGSISKTAAGGEINCIDPGGFGALTITKAITISCEIGTAGVLVAGTNGFVVNAGAADNVVIKGIDFDGTGTGLSGIQITSAATVSLRNSVIRNFKGSGSGISLTPNGTNSKLFVSDSTISNNGSSATTGGIVVKPVGNSTATVIVENSYIENNTAGLRADATAVTTGTVRATVKNSSISGNTNDGVAGIANAASQSILMLNNSLFAHNGGTGVNITTATGLLSGSVVTANGTGLGVAGGTLFSYRNNNINGNTNDNSSVATTLTLQ